jgi:hypothetical protein
LVCIDDNKDPKGSGDIPMKNSQILTDDHQFSGRGGVPSHALVTFLKLLGFAALTLTASPSIAQVASVGQIYSYTIKDKSSFEEGYRRHLAWHAAQHDALVWYAWTVDSGPRKGAFIDGTFGATFSQLDARPNPKDDGDDFVRNVSPYVAPLDVETWILWTTPSTATPLEDKTPGAMLDAFFLQVEPAATLSFEAGLERLGAKKRNAPHLTWYKIIRGADMPTYVLMLKRENLAQIETAGSTLVEMLRNAYANDPAQTENVFKNVRNIRSEIWSYQSRLTLIPGHALEP